MMFGLPWVFWAIFLPGPLLLLALRLVTWIARAAGYRRNPRPGYIDITTAPKRARKEPA